MTKGEKQNLFFASTGKKIFYYFFQIRKTFFNPRKATLHSMVSQDGADFKPSGIIPNLKILEREKCKNFKTAKLGKNYFLTYDKNAKVYGSSSTNLTRWKYFGVLYGIRNSGAIVPDFFYDKDRVMYTGEKNIKIAYSKNLRTWREAKTVLLKSRPGKFDSGKIMPAAAFVEDDGIALFYYALGKGPKYSLGLALFSCDNPEKLIYRSEKAIWSQSNKEKLNPLGVLKVDGKFVSFWETKTRETFSIVLPSVLSNQHKDLKITLKKLDNNPVLKPIKNHEWESVAAFNPTTFEYKNKIYILYRALGHDALSTVGCAISNDGISIEERLRNPIYVPREPFEGSNGVIFDEQTTPRYMSGGGWGGCEDARVTLFGQRVYLLYAAYDGHHEPNVAISSIKLKDFLDRKWELWTRPILITCSDIKTKDPKAVRETLKDRPGQTHTGEKDAALLPEKVKGKYVIFHRIWPNIVIDFVDDLNFDGKKFLRGTHLIETRPLMWDSYKICLAATPVRIKEGWLMIYNGVDKRDMSKYKLGAMILDAKNPAKVLYRSAQPILEPTESYENNGLKYGVAFGGGAIIKDGTLFVYYGGSDQYSCIATHDLKDFVKKLKTGGTPQLHKIG